MLAGMQDWKLPVKSRKLLFSKIHSIIPQCVKDVTFFESYVTFISLNLTNFTLLKV